MRIPTCINNTLELVIFISYYFYFQTILSSILTKMDISSIISDSTKKVPRPLNCFMTYRLEKQQEILQRCPGTNHRDISKITAKWWKEMTAAEKEPYRLSAHSAKLEHEKM